MLSRAARGGARQSGHSVPLVPVLGERELDQALGRRRTRDPAGAELRRRRRWTAIIGDAVAQAADPRYMRVDGRPLFLVYRPLQLPRRAGFRRRRAAAPSRAPDSRACIWSMSRAWRRWTSGLRPADIGFDACVEFPPHGRAVPAADQRSKSSRMDWSGYRYDYPATPSWRSSRARPCPTRAIPAVFPSWDNTPRQRLRGTSFDAATPEIFRCYVEEKIEEVRQFLMGDERLLFVNAWNEWAEGTHLEPDSGLATAGWRRCATRSPRSGAPDASDGDRHDNGARRGLARAGRGAGHAHRPPLSRRSAWASRCAATCAPATRLRMHHRVFDIFRYAQRTDAAHVRADRSRWSATTRRGGHPHVPHQRRRGRARGHARSRSAAAIFAAATTSSCRPGNCRSTRKAGRSSCAASTRCGRCRASSRRAWPRRDHAATGSARRWSSSPGRCCRAAPSAFANPPLCCCILSTSRPTPARKNPEAVLALFDRIRREDPFRDVQLVLKVKDRRARRGGLGGRAAPRPAGQGDRRRRSIRSACKA